MRATALCDLAFAAGLGTVAVAGACRARSVVRVAKPATLAAVAARLAVDAPGRTAATNSWLGATVLSAFLGDYLMYLHEFQPPGPTRERLLLSGAAAFGLTQAGYLTLLGLRGARPAPGRLLGRMALLVQPALLVRRWNPRLLPGLAGYGVALAAMSAASASPALHPEPAARRIRLGGWSFLLSDALIANRVAALGGDGGAEHRPSSRIVEFAILVSYFLAQYWLLTGIDRAAGEGKTVAPGR